MKMLLFAALLFFSLPLRADWVIVEKTSGSDKAKEKTMTIKIKDNAIRSDLDNTMTVLIDPEGGAQMFMHAKKTSLRMDPSTMKDATSLASKFLGGGSDTSSKATPTGEKVRVGQWDTEVYTWQGKLGSGRFFIAKDFPGFADLNKLMDRASKASNNPMAGMFPKNTDFPGMVVKSELSMLGKTTVTELVSATETPVSADEFKAPEGYKEMKLPAFPKGLLQGKQP